MSRKQSKERLVSQEEVKAAADRAERAADGIPIADDSDVVTKSDPLNPPEDRRGRPTGYKPEFIKIAQNLCERGFTDDEIADTFSITVRTLYRWRAKYPEFCQAMASGKSLPNERVERSLYMRAIGYTYEAEKITRHGEVLTYKVHVPPDPVAQKFWLMNRSPSEWRDRRELEVGKPGDFADMAREELMHSLQEDLMEFGPALLKGLPAADKKKANRVKGNDTTH